MWIYVGCVVDYSVICGRWLFGDLKLVGIFGYIWFEIDLVIFVGWDLYWVGCVVVCDWVGVDVVDWVFIYNSVDYWFRVVFVYFFYFVGGCELGGCGIWSCLGLVCFVDVRFLWCGIVGFVGCLGWFE